MSSGGLEAFGRVDIRCDVEGQVMRKQYLPATVKSPHRSCQRIGRSSEVEPKQITDCLNPARPDDAACMPPSIPLFSLGWSDEGRTGLDLDAGLG